MAQPLETRPHPLHPAVGNANSHGRGWSAFLRAAGKARTLCCPPLADEFACSMQQVIPKDHGCSKGGEASHNNASPNPRAGTGARIGGKSCDGGLLSLRATSARLCLLLRRDVTDGYLHTHRAGSWADMANPPLFSRARDPGRQTSELGREVQRQEGRFGGFRRGARQQRSLFVGYCNPT